MSALSRVGGVAVLAAALLLSGCGAMFSGYDLAPNGLPRAEDELRRQLADRPQQAYTSLLEGGVDLPDDDLIRLLFAGTAGRYAGAHHESARLLDMASYLADDRVTVSLSQQALSMITLDRALGYTPGTHERLMIHYLAAAAYLEAGDLDAAAVEARRIEARLDRMQAEETDVAGRPFFHTMAAEIFDAAGYPDAADVARRRAAAARATGQEADPNADAGPDLEGDTPPSGDVVVLVETGQVPHRVEQSVVVVLPPWQVDRLTDGDAGDKAAAALGAAARVLFYAQNEYGARGWYRDHGYRRGLRLSPWERCDGDENCDESDDEPYLLRISWPVLYQPSPGRIPVQLESGTRVGETGAVLDVAEGARQDFDAERPAMLARTLVRAVSKLALSSAAEEAVRKEDETAGQIIGLLTNLGTLLTERADTRCWHLLPGQVRLIRLRLPAGTHALELTVGGRRVDLGVVAVQAGRTTFLTHRVW